MSALERQFLQQLRAAQLPEPEQQFRFCEGRKWAADFCWPDIGLIVEIDGGAFIQGRHNRAAGRSKDCQRDAEAALLGFTVYRATTALVKNGEAVRTAERLINYLMDLQPTTDEGIR